MKLTASQSHLSMELLESREVPSAAGIYAIGGGPGGLPLVKVYDTATNALVADFLAFEPAFTGGVTVAVADITNDGVPEVIVGAGAGGGPRVRVFDGRAFNGTSDFPQAPLDGSLIANQTEVADFFTFEASQRGGVTVAGGNIVGTANADLIVGAGPGGGPRVRIFDGQAITAERTAFTGNQPGSVGADFFAFESSFRDGVLVSVSPSNGSITAEYLTVAPGAGGSPRIRVLSGSAIAQQTTRYTSNATGDVVADFISGDANSRGGAFVATADFNRDGALDIAVGSGVGSIGTVTVYNGSNIEIEGTKFTGTQSGDVINSFTVDGNDYTNGVAVGGVVETLGENNGLLLYGFGGNGVASQAILDKYQVVSGGVSRTQLNGITFDSTDRGVFVSE